MPNPLTTTALEAAFVSFDLTFRKALSDAKPIWNRIASLKTSDTESEVYGWLDVIPEMREWLGAREIDSLSLRSQTITNKLFEKTYGLNRSKFEDDKLGFFSDGITELGRVAGLWPDLQVSLALQNGGGALVYDSQPFFNNAHPVNMDDPASPTQSNDFDYHATGVGGSPAGLTSENLADAYAQMGSLLNAGGTPFQVEPDLLVVPPALEFRAKEILAMETIAAYVPGSTTVGGGAQNVMRGVMEVLKAPRLATAPGVTPVYVYLMDTRRSVKPLIWQLREAPEFAYRFRPDDPTVFDYNELLAGVRARGAAGYGPWYLAGRMRVA